MYLSSVSSRLLLHDTNTWELKKSYGCYDGLLRDISWSDDGKYLLQVNPKGIVEILSTAENEVRSLQHVPLRETWSASFHRDGHRNVAIGTRSGNVLIWDTKNKNITKTFPTPSQQVPVNFISYNAKNSSLAASMQNGDTIIYGLNTNISVLTVRLNCSKNISAMKFHHESRIVLGLATEEGHVAVRDIAANKDKAFFENIHASPVSDFAFSLINKDVMLSCGYDKMMQVYDIRSQNVVSTLRTSYTLSSLAINAENQVALGTKNGCILIYDLRDLVNPLQVLKGHNEEVKKVNFQPIKRKTMSTEVSLRENTDIMYSQRLLSPSKVASPHHNSQDIFLVGDSMSKHQIESPITRETSRVDSFLVMVGLDKTNNDVDEHRSKMSEVERKSDRQEARLRAMEVENKMKVSTPLNSRIGGGHIIQSPFYQNGILEDGDSNSNVSNAKQSIGDLRKNANNYEIKNNEELKDFIKLTMSDVADDNRNYFLHVMMSLTKQKLYLEKQMSEMNHQIGLLVQNQNALVESNRRLALEIETLKSQKQ